jgi:hypothetical protein
VGLSTLLSRGPIHFRPPIASPVLSPHLRAPLPSPHVRAPLPSHVGPQQQDQSVCSQESSHPSGPPWGSASPRHEASIHFRLHIAAQFEFSPLARAGPKAAVVDDEGVGLPGKLIRPSRCHPPPRSSPYAFGHYFSVRIQFNVPGPPHVIILRTQAVGMK